MRSGDTNADAISPQPGHIHEQPWFSEVLDTFENDKMSFDLCSEVWPITRWNARADFGASFGITHGPRFFDLTMSAQQLHDLRKLKCENHQLIKPR